MTDRWEVLLSFEVAVQAVNAPDAMRRAKRLVRAGKVPVARAEASKVE